MIEGSLTEKGHTHRPRISAIHALGMGVSEPTTLQRGACIGEQPFALECFGRLLESSCDAVALLDASGTIFYANVQFATLQAALASVNLNARARPLLLPAFRGLRRWLEKQGSVCTDAAQRQPACTIEISLDSATRRFSAYARVIIFETSHRAMQQVTMLVLHDSYSETLERMRVFSTMYELTIKESQVLELFLNGKDLSAISAQLHVTIHTARAHMKSLLSKTGCCRQPELVCLFTGTSIGRFQLNF